MSKIEHLILQYDTSSHLY